MPPTHDETSSLVGSRSPPRVFLDTPLGSFKGPNSLHNFASSFTRAQLFAASKIDNEIHRKRSFFTLGDNGTEDETFDPELMVPSVRGERLSTVIHEIPHGNRLFSNLDPVGSNEVFYQDDLPGPGYDSSSNIHRGFSNPHLVKNIPRHRPSIASFRSAVSRLTTASQVNLIHIEDKNGNSVAVLEGQSTAPQTIFNSINVLIGVGLLALPVGIYKAGWIFGVPILIACALTTYWTATLLSKAMDTDHTIMTYADLGYASYGSLAKLFISIIFLLDLIGSGVSLIVLFSDSLFALCGDDITWTRTRFKLVSFIVLTPFTFMPLPILSLFSLFGIASTISITLLVFILGLTKASAPGSLLDAMPTNMWPASKIQLLLGLGILMAPFGGHAIFPNLKCDMRHPVKFALTLRSTYVITLVTDLSMGVLGFLMFGSLCSNEITNTILLTPGYPQFCYPLISGLICMIPLAKVPLNVRPIVSTLDEALGINRPANTKWRALFNRAGSVSTRVAVNLLFVGLAILFPEFERIIGIMGASVCFVVCIILPCLFYVRLCGTTASKLELVICKFAVFVSTLLALMATWATLAF